MSEPKHQSESLIPLYQAIMKVHFFLSVRARKMNKYIFFKIFFWVLTSLKKSLDYERK